MKLWFVIGTLIISGICFSINPNLLFFAYDGLLILPKPYKTHAIKLRSLNSSCKAIKQYRSNIERTGHNSKATISANASIIKKIPNVNVGIHGASKASPTVDETGLYLASDTGWLTKYSHAGDILWRFFAATSDNGFHGTPAVDEKKIFIGAYNGYLYSLDKMTGELVWANPVSDFIGASPLLANGSVYIANETGSPNGYSVKLDCNTGETIWTSNFFGSHSHSSPVYDKKTDSLFLGANSKKLVSIANKNGSTNWEFDQTMQAKGTPLVVDDKVIFTNWDGGIIALDTKTGSQVWKRSFNGRWQGSPSLLPKQKLVVINTGMSKTVALNLNDGDVAWDFPNGMSDLKSSSLTTVAKDQTPLVWTLCFDTYLCTLNGENGTLISKRNLGQKYSGMPVAFKSRLYLALDADGGAIILE